MSKAILIICLLVLCIAMAQARKSSGRSSGSSCQAGAVRKCGSSPTNGPTACRAAYVAQCESRSSGSSGSSCQAGAVRKCGSSPTNGPTACRAAYVAQCESRSSGRHGRSHGKSASSCQAGAVRKCGSSPTNGPTACRAAYVAKCESRSSGRHGRSHGRKHHSKKHGGRSASSCQAGAVRKCGSSPTNGPTACRAAYIAKCQSRSSGRHGRSHGKSHGRRSASSCQAGAVRKCGSSPTNGPTACRAAYVAKCETKGRSHGRSHHAKKHHAKKHHSKKHGGRSASSCQAGAVRKCGSSPTNGPTACRAAYIAKCQARPGRSHGRRHGKTHHNYKRHHAKKHHSKKHNGGRRSNASCQAGAIRKCGSSPTNGPTACRAAYIATCETRGRQSHGRSHSKSHGRQHKPVYAQPIYVQPAPVYVQPAPVQPAQPVYVQPAPVQPVYVAPAPVAPTPIDQPQPAPVQPVYVAPAPVVTAPVDQPQPAPVQPVYVAPAPVAPTPVDQPAPVQPVYVAPAPVVTAPVDQPAPAVPAPYVAPVAPSTNSGDGVWRYIDYDRDGAADLVFIKWANTPSGNVEVHVASAASNYQTRIFESATTFANEVDGTWRMADYDRDGVPDLVFIKTSNTPSGNVEVHVASAASNFQTRIFESATTFVNEVDGVWLMADYDRDGVPDLVFIKTSNTPSGYVEVHVASAASNYQTRIFESATTFVNEVDGVWRLTDYDKDGIPDLVFIKWANTPANNIEVHVASASSNYQTRIFELGTTFAVENNGSWRFADYDKDGVPDLCYIKIANTPSNYVEVHVASASSNYQTRVFESATTFVNEGVADV